jgi:hypothetical protein
VAPHGVTIGINASIPDLLGVTDEGNLPIASPVRKMNNKDDFVLRER